MPADVSHNPFGNWKVGNYVETPTGSTPGAVVSLFPYTERAGAGGAQVGSAGQTGRHVIYNLDYGTNPVVADKTGRWFEMYTIGGSGLTAETVHSSRKLLATTSPLKPPPKLAAHAGTVFLSDGAPRQVAPGMCNMLLLAIEGGVTAGTWNTVLYNALTTARPVSTTISTGAVDRAYFFGAPGKFAGMQFKIGTQGVGTWTITWEYWNGTAWAALAGVSDGTTGFTAATGNRTLNFTEPTDWVPNKVGGNPSVGNLYWIRARVSAFTALTTNCVLTSYEVGASTDILSAFVTVFAAVETDDTADSATQAANDMTLGSAAAGDYVAFGAGATFRGLLVDIGTIGVGTYTVAWEYWSGSAWTALSGVTDNTSNFKNLGYRYVLFTVPTDWATTTLAGLTKYYIRARYVSGTMTTTPLGNQAWIFSTARSAAVSSVGYHIGEKPGTVAPVVIGWGVDNLENREPPGARLENVATGGSLGASTLDVRFELWDSKRERASALSQIYTVTIGGGGGDDSLRITLHDHNAADVDMVRIYVGTSGGTLYRVTFADGRDMTEKGSTVTLTAATQWPTTNPTPDTDAASGPTVDKTGDQNSLLNGQFVACARSRVRMACFGGTGEEADKGGQRLGFANRFVWSVANKFHYFRPSDNVEISQNDGDRGTGMEELFEKFLCFKENSIHAAVFDEGGNVTVTRLTGDLGCVAPRTIVRAGNILIFLHRDGLWTIDAAGNTSKIPLTEPIRDLIQKLNANQLGNACAAYWPETQTYFLAVPGLQELTSGGASPAAVSGVTGASQPINDGLLVLHLPTGYWSIWPGIYASSLATVPKSDFSTEIWYGDYFGRLHRFDDDKLTDGMVVSGASYSGTVASATSTTVTVTNGAWPASATDRRLVGQFMWIYQGTGAGQVRRVTASTATIATVAPAFDTTPDGTSLFAIGHIYWHVEFGDWTFGDVTETKALTDLELLLQTALVSGNSIDAAVDGTDVDESTGFTWAASTVATGVHPPRRLALPRKTGYTQRLRINGRVSASPRPEIKGLAVTAQMFGSPRGVA